MKYYKVIGTDKIQFVHKKSGVVSHGFKTDELYTKAELDKLIDKGFDVPTNWFTEAELPRNRIHFFIGRRYENRK